jgi:hypothetical protein
MEKGLFRLCFRTEKSSSDFMPFNQFQGLISESRLETDGNDYCSHHSDLIKDADRCQ